MLSLKGWKTSEFWLSLLAIVISAMVLAEVFPSESVWAKILLVASIILSSLGYTVSRAYTKINAMKVETYKEEIGTLKEEVSNLKTENKNERTESARANRDTDNKTEITINMESDKEKGEEKKENS